MSQEMIVSEMMGGAVQDEIERAIKKALSNINDVNTVFKKKRVIIAKWEITPVSQDRVNVDVKFDVSEKLAGREPVKKIMVIEPAIDGFELAQTRQQPLPEMNRFKEAKAIEKDNVFTMERSKTS